MELDSTPSALVLAEAVEVRAYLFNVREGWQGGHFEGSGGEMALYSCQTQLHQGKAAREKNRAEEDTSQCLNHHCTCMDSRALETIKTEVLKDEYR